MTFAGNIPSKVSSENAAMELVFHIRIPFVRSDSCAQLNSIFYEPVGYVCMLIDVLCWIQSRKIFFPG